MDRTLMSFRFLASTAVCCGLAVAFTTWVTNDSPGSLRALAALIGLGSSLAVMLLVAWAVAPEAGLSVPAAAPEQAPTEASRVVVAPPTAPSSDARSALTQLLNEGVALREEIEPAATDPRVDAWIDRVREAIDRHKPGVAGYVNALSQRAYADGGARLDAHIRRLATVVRDLM